MSTQDEHHSDDVTTKAPLDGGKAPGKRRGSRIFVIAALVAGFVALAGVVAGTSRGESAPAGREGSSAASAAAVRMDPQATTPVVAQGPLPPSPPHVEGTPRERAGALRRDATQACKAGLWDRCRTDLAQSARVDPEGDQNFAVQRLHRIAEQGGRD